MNEITAHTINRGFQSTLVDWGFSDTFAGYLADFSVLIIILFVTIIIYYVAKFIINRVLKRLVEKSVSKWDDHLYEQRVFTRLVMLLPALVLKVSLAPSIAKYPEAIRFIELGLHLYIAFIIVLVIISFLNAVYHIYSELDVADSKPIKGYVQIGKIITYVLGGIAIISILIGQSPMTLLAGLGAMSAILLLIFKDSILGFVAGVQLSSNRMLQIGDWITMPKYNADGTVLDISLVTVKVQNFDNSVCFIPAYALISDSFQNWRNMEEAGGRRMKRSILIDIGTVRFPDATILENLKKKGIFDDKIQSGEINTTNLGLFRNYTVEYLRKTPLLNQDASLMVRTLQPTEFGIPMEIYTFYKPPDWGEFEDFQSKLFEHLLAILPEFGLKAFQRSS
ncbi:MAG: mechanosensitive ion channel [Bacteroidales bacterium]|nr:mechanosensitive ion channel family protein [Bacteroidales bacterium]MDD4603807.1 mechanosensitive ion channel [Bacteroidales bacterium]